MQRRFLLPHRTMNEKKYLVALSSFIEFGPARIKLLVSYFGSAKNVWRADDKKLGEIGLSLKLLRKFKIYKQEFDFENFFKGLKKVNADVVTINESGYPDNLKELEDAPIVLYVRGKMTKADINAVAIVGSRKMTSYGKEVAERISTQLAKVGVTVVSGMAFGVDITAHKAALSTGGRCVGVLASGIDKITPRSNDWLGKNVIKEGGAIISEYPPGVDAQKHFFPYRNRIISGLSKAVVVVEGKIKSGTIHTANHAAAQGRQVFAVPGHITSPLSGAPHYLIKNGACLLEDAKDILEELNLQFKVNKEAMETVLPSDETEKQLLDLLANEPLHLDEIVRISGLDINIISSTLTILELKGVIRNIGNGIYKPA
jgi:DNA processing protein